LLRKKLKRNQITCVVLEGNASSMIIQEARDCGADLIVIGSHGETGVRKTQVGSVTAAVVNSAPCSVDVVKVGKCQPSNPAVGGVA
jgi:nucleotide-binding universal stress UspA family protein